MTDSIQQPFERFTLSEEDLQNLSSSPSNTSAERMMIPIMKRSIEAESQSKKLREVSPVCVLVVGMAGSGKTTLMAALQRSLTVSGSDNTNNDDNSNGNGDGAKTEEGNEDENEQSTATIEKINKNDESSTDRAAPVGYCLNLDPATKLVPFGASIDIRDTVDYKEVMKQHKLGPNGAIMTSLNLFSTKFDQVMTILENRAFPPTQQQQPPKEEENTNIDTDSSSPTTPTKALDYILVDTPGQIEAFTWSASGTIITSALASAFPTVLAFVIDTPRCVASLNTFM
jgi:GTPase SAR1 family protein